MLKIVSPGNPSAFFDEETPSSEEASERISRTGDPDSADSVFMRCDPTPEDGETDAILEDTVTGERFRYDFGDGKCYAMQGELLPREYVDRVEESELLPHGNASTSQELKKLIASVVPFIGSPENATLKEEEEVWDV